MIIKFTIIGALLILYIRLFFNQHFNYLYFEYKKYQANQKWKTTNKQHYLIPLNNRLILVNNDTKERYNRIARKQGIKILTVVNLDSMAYYKTPAGNYVDYEKKAKM